MFSGGEDYSAASDIVYSISNWVIFIITISVITLTCVCMRSRVRPSTIKQGGMEGTCGTLN